MKWRYLLAELWQRKGRTIAAVLSIASAVALLLSLQAYAQGYRVAARTPLAEIGADIAAQRQGAVPEAFTGPVFPHAVAPIRPEEVARIRQLAGVEAVSEAVFFWDFGPTSFLVVLGLAAGETTGPGRLQGAVAEGRFFTPGERGVAVADVSFAREHTLGLGQVVTVGGQDFTLIGLVDTTRAGQIANANLYLPLADAQALVAAAPNVRAVHTIQPSDANILFIKANQALAEQVAADVRAILGADALVSSARSFDEVLGQTYLLVDRFGWLVGLFALLVAVAVLLRAIAANLWERRRDIGLMRAVGWTRAAIIRQLTGEALLLALAGGSGGLALAALLTTLLGRTQVTVPVPWELSPTPHFLPGGAKTQALTIALPAQIALPAIGVAYAVTLGGSLLVGYLLASRAAQIKPAEVLRSE